MELDAKQAIEETELLKTKFAGKVELTESMLNTVECLLSKLLEMRRQQESATNSVERVRREMDEFVPANKDNGQARHVEKRTDPSRQNATLRNRLRQSCALYESKITQVEIELAFFQKECEHLPTQHRIRESRENDQLDQIISAGQLVCRTFAFTSTDTLSTTVPPLGHAKEPETKGPKRSTRACKSKLNKK